MGYLRSHSEVDAHCLVSRQVGFSRGSKFGSPGGS
jgi:hypothetical protein